MAILKWTELTQEQKEKAIDWDVNPECVMEDAWESTRDYRESLKLGQDAVFLRYIDLIDWWDNCDEETQQEILNPE